MVLPNDPAAATCVTPDESALNGRSTGALPQPPSPSSRERAVRRILETGRQRAARRKIETADLRKYRASLASYRRPQRPTVAEWMAANPDHPLVTGISTGPTEQARPGRPPSPPSTPPTTRPGILGMTGETWHLRGRGWGVECFTCGRITLHHDSKALAIEALRIHRAQTHALPAASQTCGSACAPPAPSPQAHHQSVATSAPADEPWRPRSAPDRQARPAP